MASEVGNGQVAIFPTFRGFRRGVQKEIEAAERTGSAKFRKGFSRSSAVAGQDAGKGFRRGFTAGSKDLAKDMQADVAKASKVVSAARLKEQDAAGKVRVAEAQLAEARGKYAADSSQVVRAEERLATAQRGLKAAQDVTRAGTDQLTDAQKRLADAAGKASRSGAGFAAMRTNVSKLLAPVTALSKGVTGLASKAFTPLFQKVGQVASKVTGPMRAAFSSAVGGMRDFGLSVAMKVVSPLSRAENVLRSRFGPQLDGLKRGLAPIGTAFQGAFGLAGQAIRGVGQVMGPVASAIGRTFSAAMSGVSRAASAAMAGVKRVSADAAQFVGSTFKAAGAAVGATLGVAITKGFGRLSAIDTARTKLKALGNSAEDVERLMNGALESVKGTAFGLGDAAGAAASLAAAKVPLDLVDRALKSVSSTAAVAGAGMDEMGGIFAKVAANQKLDGEVVAQLMDRQVPILSMIADHYKVTGAEAKKMVSEGKVSFEDFVGITGQLGDAAKVMGTSFKGMAQNVGAALGRMGAVIIGPAFDGLKQIMPGVMNVIDQVTEAIKPLFDTLGQKVAPVFERVGKALEGWKFDGSGLSSFTSTLGPLLPVIGAAVGFLGTMLARLPIIGGLFGGLTAPLGLAIGLFTTLFAFKPDQLFDGMMKIIDGAGEMTGMLVEGLTGALSKLGTDLMPRLMENAPILIQGVAGLLQAVIDAVLAGLPGLLNVLMGLAPQLLNAILLIVPQMLDAGIRLITGLVDGLAVAIPQVVDAIVTVIPALVEAITSQLPQFVTAGITLFTGLVESITTTVPIIVEALVAALPVILEALISALPLVIEAGIQLLMGLVESIVAAVPIIIEALLAAVPLILEALLAQLPVLVETGIQLFLGLVQAVTTIIPELIGAIAALLPSIVNAVVGMIPTLLLAAVDLFVQLVKALPIVLPQLIIAIVAMIPKVVSTIIGMIPQLLQAGIQLFKGLIQALPVILPQLLTAVKNLVPQMVNALIGLVPRFLDAGVQLIRGLMDGIASMAGSIGSFFLDLLPGWIVGPFKAALGIHSPSRVFAEFGKNIGQGLAIGITGTEAQVKKATQSLSKKVTDTFKKAAAERDKAIKALPAQETKLIGQQNSLARQQERLRAAKKRGDKSGAAAVRRDIALTKRKIAAQKALIASTKATIKTNTAALKGGTEKRILSAVSAAEKKLVGIARQRATVATQLKDAEKGLKDLVKKSADTVAKIRSEIAESVDVSRFSSTSGMVDSLKKQIARVTEFKAKLDKLMKLGLDSTSRDQLLEQFLSNGSSRAADALLNGGKAAVEEVANLRKQLDTAGGGLGKAVADDMYKAGIQAAEGLVRGLKSKQKQLEDAAKKIADALAKQVKKRLGIKSPSRVFMAIGSDTGEGFARGIEGEQDRVQAAMDRVIPDASRMVALNGAALRSYAQPVQRPVGSGVSVYVQNPFTGEYLLAKVAHVAGAVLERQVPSRTALFAATGRTGR